jgi:hypothetical protein
MKVCKIWSKVSFNENCTAYSKTMQMRIKSMIIKLQGIPKPCNYVFYIIYIKLFQEHSVNYLFLKFCSWYINVASKQERLQ